MKILPFVPSHQHLMDVMNTSYHFTSSLSNCENSWLGSLVWWMGEIKSKLNQACSVIQKLSDPNATTVCTVRYRISNITFPTPDHIIEQNLFWSGRIMSYCHKPDSYIKSLNSHYDRSNKKLGLWPIWIPLLPLLIIYDRSAAWKFKRFFVCWLSSIKTLLQWVRCSLSQSLHASFQTDFHWPAGAERIPEPAACWHPLASNVAVCIHHANSYETFYSSMHMILESRPSGSAQHSDGIGQVCLPFEKKHQKRPNLRCRTNLLEELLSWKQLQAPHPVDKTLVLSLPPGDCEHQRFCSPLQSLGKPLLTKEAAQQEQEQQYLSHCLNLNLSHLNWYRHRACCKCCPNCGPQRRYQIHRHHLKHLYFPDHHRHSLAHVQNQQLRLVFGFFALVEQQLSVDRFVFSATFWLQASDQRATSFFLNRLGSLHQQWAWAGDTCGFHFHKRWEWVDLEIVNHKWNASQHFSIWKFNLW